jgi:hypothetical protein
MACKHPIEYMETTAMVYGRHRDVSYRCRLCGCDIERAEAEAACDQLLAGLLNGDISLIPDPIPGRDAIVRPTKGLPPSE